MKLLEIVQKIEATHTAHLVRPRRDRTQPREYDAAPYFSVGKKHGWVILDATTAHAMATVYAALSDVNKAKFNNIGLGRMVAFCWEHVRVGAA